MVHKTWEICFKFHQRAGLVLAALAATAIYLNHHDISHSNAVTKPAAAEREGRTASRCDFFNGRWIYDGALSPPYKEEECSFMELIFACERNGRREFKYREWRWQPHHCDIPRFDGNAFLEKIRGKKVIFVGDSLNRNQWVSLLCLLEQSLPPSANKATTLDGNLNSFHNEEYNTTIGFYWSPFLVESNCDGYNMHRNMKNRVLKIESIEMHAQKWNDADILIFNSHAWWLSPQVTTLLWGSFGSPDAIYKKIRLNERIYEMALDTWSDWLEMNLNRTKTKVFFMGSSPYPMRSDTLRHCYDRKEPIPEGDLVRANQTMGTTLASTLERLERRGVNVEYLQVTRMSEYRRDAHPSEFTVFALTDGKRRDPSNGDCLHWCLPGVPDVWNQILYAYIMKS